MTEERPFGGWKDFVTCGLCKKEWVVPVMVNVDCGCDVCPECEEDHDMVLKFETREGGLTNTYCRECILKSECQFCRRKMSKGFTITADCRITVCADCFPKIDNGKACHMCNILATCTVKGCGNLMMSEVCTFCKRGFCMEHKTQCMLKGNVTYSVCTFHSKYAKCFECGDMVIKNNAHVFGDRVYCTRFDCENALMIHKLTI